jgi:hypothetical protein
MSWWFPCCSLSGDTDIRIRGDIQSVEGHRARIQIKSDSHRCRCIRVVFPKFMVPPALVFWTKMPLPAGLVVVVVVMVRLPLTRSIVMPLVTLFVEETVPKLSGSARPAPQLFVMLIAWPLVAEIFSGVVSDCHRARVGGSHKSRSVGRRDVEAVESNVAHIGVATAPRVNSRSGVAFIDGGGAKGD